ncbi:hypothetical protein [Enterococcus sp. LJL51]|uniref:hypothetical protein n=1 Tax=Enterococcus sp. LJL51 TaxID=3416656 RepID=UPI003CE855F5
MLRKCVILGSLLIAGTILSFENVEAANASVNQKTTYYQRTAQHYNPEGSIDLSYYTQSELESLTKITHGSEYHGNTSLDKAATDHIYVLENAPLPNFVGTDGILQLYNESEMMTDTMVQAAAKYWNTLAGTTIVEVVSSPEKSDEIIHDSPEKLGALGGQTYSGDGILFYPNQWAIDSLDPAAQLDWKESTLIHEIGHALGIPHLGGGEDGYNAQRDNISGTEFMAPWTTGLWNSPKENSNGVKSTAVDAAALALAGLSWEQPKKLSSWILTSPEGFVNYHDGKITTNLDTLFGIRIDFEGNYIQTKQQVNVVSSIIKNYNVYTINEEVLNNKAGISSAKVVGTTNGMGLTDKDLTILAYYTSTKGNSYYKISADGQEYVVNSRAFDTKFGIEIDFKENYIQTKKEVSTVLSIIKNYNVYTIDEAVLELGFGRSAAKTVQTTNGLGLIGKEVNIIAYYTSTKGNPYYKISVDGQEYVVNIAAFES